MDSRVSDLNELDISFNPKKTRTVKVIVAKRAKAHFETAFIPLEPQPDKDRLLTDIDGRDTQRAIKDLEKHKLPALFSYRQAYFVGCEAQLAKDDTYYEARTKEILERMEIELKTHYTPANEIPFSDWWQSLKSKYLGDTK